MKIRALIILVIFLPISLLAQIDRMSEAEIQAQGKFLDALQLRILEKYDEAIEAFVVLEKEEPNNDVVHFELAKLYYVKGQDSEAIQHAQKAIQLRPGKKVYKEFLIDLYNRQNDFNALIEALTDYLEAGNYSKKYYFQLINSYQRTRDYKSALKTLDQLEDRIGYTKSIGQKRAGIFRRQNKKRNLVRELNKLSQTFPDDTSVLLQAATLFQSAGEEEEAYNLYQRILEIDPNHVAANTKLATWQKKASTETEFLSSLEELIKNQHIPLDEKVKQLVPYVPRLEKGSELTTEMFRLMNLMEELYPEDAKIQALYGDVFFNTGQLEEAVPYYHKTIELNKSVFMVWKNLMLAQDNTRDFKGLKATAESAVDYFPNQAVCYYYAGKANIELGRMDDGMDWLHEGIIMVGNNPILNSEYHLLMSFYYALDNQSDKAKDQFKKVDGALLGPRHAFYFEVKGDIENIQGREEDAVKSWKQSLMNGGPKDRLEKKISTLEKND